MPDSTDYMRKDGDTLRVDLWYPRCKDRPQYIEVGLVDVRCVPNIRLSFDFDENVWIVECETNSQGWVKTGTIDPEERDDE